MLLFNLTGIGTWERGDPGSPLCVNRLERLFLGPAVRRNKYNIVLRPKSSHPPHEKKKEKHLMECIPLSECTCTSWKRKKKMHLKRRYFLAKNIRRRKSCLVPKETTTNKITRDPLWPFAMPTIDPLPLLKSFPSSITNYKLESVLHINTRVMLPDGVLRSLF